MDPQKLNEAVYQKIIVVCPLLFALLFALPRHIEAARKLRCEHADPFDRLLIAQAQDERLTLVTRDVAILGLELEGVAKG